jgi:hypothetical protein
MRTTLKIGLLGWLVGLGWLPLRAEFRLPDSVETRETAVYPATWTQSRLQGNKGHISLQFPYASPVIQNPEAYAERQGYEVVGVDLVFTRYPEEFQDWRTDYGWLLEHRLRALYALDSALFSPERQLRWRYVLQTACQTEPEAKQMFHGLVLFLRPAPPGEELEVLRQTHPPLSPVIRQIFQGPLKDSTIYQVLEAHAEWERKLVVMDWTASMYDNGAALMNWHRKQLAGSGIRHLVLFNDGNWKPHHLKKIGRTGGIYHIEPTNLEEVIALMGEVMENGLGGDPAENDLEALLRATKTLTDYAEVILIPDRNSSIRDLQLLPLLRVPVRIVLFRNGLEQQVGLGARDTPQENRWIHPHYLTLASLTRGSIHTFDRELTHLHELQAGEFLTYGRYRYQKQPNGSFRHVRD